MGPRRRRPQLAARLLIVVPLLLAGLLMVERGVADPAQGSAAETSSERLQPPPEAEFLLGDDPVVVSTAAVAGGAGKAGPPRGAQAVAGPDSGDRRLFAGAARITIPAAGVHAEVVDGTTVEHLAQGPGFYPEGSLPHLGGNVAIAGHRTTYGAWFRHLDRLEAGDPIFLLYDGNLYRYEVERVWVIAYNDWSVIAPTGEHVLTLTTCHPPGSSAYRLAVRARWVETIDLNARAPV